jgi:F-type H+-transporting ATPase subunit delta
MVDRSKGTQPVEIVSAKTMDLAAQEQLKTQLRTSLKREVELVVQTDPALLAGLQIKIGSTVYDSTLRNRLNSMKTLLMHE